MNGTGCKPSVFTTVFDGMVVEVTVIVESGWDQELFDLGTEALRELDKKITDAC